MITKILVLLISIFCTSNANFSSRHVHPDVFLNEKQVVQKYGYPLEVHSIQTEDGYILETHRIPHGRYKANEGLKHPVLFVAGLTCSPGAYLTMGPQDSLAFILADEGYDVWLLHYRGTTWSRKHITLDPVEDEKTFFDYSFQEIGLYDLTSTIDYILNVTQYQKLFYIGHSQGTTSFFAMAAARPEYNEKIQLMTALAPVAYTTHTDHVLFPIFKQYLNEIQEYTEEHKIYSSSSHSFLSTLYAQIFCNDDSVLQPICVEGFYVFAGYSSYFNKTLIPVIASILPAGGSIRMLFHYVQQGVAETFQFYDFGQLENIERYGQPTPPVFDIGKITAPVALYYGNLDVFASIQDVTLLAKQLPNVVKSKYIDGFSHVDFIWAYNAVSFLYNEVVQTIKDHS